MSIKLDNFDVNPITNIYLKRLDEYKMKADPDQLLAAKELDRMYLDLSNKADKSWFSSLFIAQKNKIKSLYFYGPPGRGKSMLMDIAFSYMPVTAKKRIHFHEFMQQIHSSLADIRKQSSSNPLSKLAAQIALQFDLICFDEFEVINIADAMILGIFIKELITNGCTLIITSNTTVDNLYKHGIQRDNFVPFINLVKKEFTQVSFLHKTDYRNNTTLDDNSVISTTKHKKKILTIWHAMDCAFHIKTTDVELDGRIFQFAGLGNFTAFIEFEKLCAIPSSSNDYLIMAKKYPALLINNVPILQERERQYAKRMANLIDVYYDKKNLLGIICKEMPDQLFAYYEQQYARSSSRLTEMASSQWKQQALNIKAIKQ